MQLVFSKGRDIYYSVNNKAMVRGICMDNLTKEQRHKNMKNIRSKDTKIEVKLRKALWNKGYRYRKNYKNLPGILI